MNIDIGMSARASTRLGRWWARVIRVLTWPIDLTLALLGWLVSAVLARVVALGFLLVTHVGEEAELARMRRDMRVRLTEAEAEMRLAVEVHKRRMRLIAEGTRDLDRMHAAANPRFTESLAVLIAAYEAETESLQRLPDDPSLQARIDAVLNGGHHR